MFRPQKLHYAWIVTAVTFLTLLSVAGIRSSPGVLMVPLETEFHWSRATISVAVGINLLLYGLIGPFAAAGMEKFGVRRTMLLALTLITAGVLLTPLMRESWQLILLWGFVVGAGTGFIANVTAAVVAARWFVARRGTVIGILSSSTAAGQILFLPALAAVTSAYGWRVMAFVVAGVSLLLMIPVVLLMRDRPEDVGQRRYGEPPNARPETPLVGSPFGIAMRTLAEGLRSRDFLLLAGSFFVCGASTNGLIGTHLIPACIDHGIAEVAAAGLLGSMAVFNFIGTTGSGWLSDRVDNRVLLAIYYGLRGVSLMFLPFSFVSFYGLSLFAIFYGLDWFATVPPTIRLTSNAFGPQKTGIMFGWLLAAHQLGGASAAYVAGAMRVDLGSYLEAFIISGILCLIAAVMVMFIGRGRSACAPAGVVSPA